MAASTTEELPIGVGRVPQWWMEITPHHTLDREEEQYKKEQEAQMSVLFSQLSEMESSGLLDEFGRPKLDADGNPVAWKLGGWGGRKEIDSTEEGQEGQTFQARGAFLDPKIFGINEDDPDYKAYLTGAKLPPGYMEMMEKYKKGDLNGETLNNLKQTNFGNYGRQAEKPEFKPTWAGMKLKKTNQGNMIRSGEYEDSPSNVLENLKKPESPESASPSSTNEKTDTSEPVSASLTNENKDTPEPASPSSTNETPETPELASPPSTNESPSYNERSANISIQVVENSKSVTKETSPPEQAPKPQNYKFNDYYYNAPSVEKKPENKVPTSEAKDEGEEEQSEKYEEEYEEEEETTQASAAPVSDESKLADLQSILAEKQAELRRLQALSS